MNYDKMIFMSNDAQKQWDEMPESTKRFVRMNLKETASKMEAKIAIDMLCAVINELEIRIKALENAK